VPERRKPDAKFDTAGAVALVLLLGPLSFALSNGDRSGWTSPLTLLPLALAAVAACALAFTARRLDDPLIEWRYFRHPRYLMATLGMFFSGISFFCLFIYFNLFAQSAAALELSAVQAGAAILPLSVMMFIVSTSAPRVLAPVSFRWPLTIGMACLALGFLLLSVTSNTTGYSEIWWKLVIIGAGMGLSFSLLPRVGLRLLPEEHAGQGSGVINTCLYFGATLGSVLGGVVTAMTVRSGLREVIAALPAGSTQSEGLSRALAHGTPSQVQQLLAGLEPATSTALSAALRDLQDNAFDNAMMVGAAGALIGLVLALLLLRGPVPPLRSAAALTQGDAAGNQIAAPDCGNSAGCARPPAPTVGIRLQVAESKGQIPNRRRRKPRPGRPHYGWRLAAGGTQGQELGRDRCRGETRWTKISRAKSKPSRPWRWTTAST
jgi:hypothetical protein